MNSYKRGIIMSTTPLEQKSLKDMSKGLKQKKQIIGHLNSIINIALLGEEVFNKKEAENIFDINKVGKKRFSENIQELYLENLLKASTPNYSKDNETFNFNTKERVGWIVLEFGINKRFSTLENIEYIKESIYYEIQLEPTLIYVQDATTYVGFFFPNSPTTKDEDRLLKYYFFKYIRTALTHTLKARWSVELENYNEVKEYNKIYKSSYQLYGNIFELAAFKQLLNEYQNSDLCKSIILKKQSHGGKKAGITKRAKTIDERKQFVEKANKARRSTSKDKLKEVLKVMLKTQESPNFSILNIVKVSREIANNKDMPEKGLARKTVAKYLKEIKSDLGIE